MTDYEQCEGQIDFLDILDNSGATGVLAKRWSECGKNDCGVFTTQYGAKYLTSGKYNDYPVLALHMARFGNWLYFTFDYQTGGDNNFYGTGSPLTEESPRVERTLCKSLALFEIERHLNNKLTNDTNLTEKSRKELFKKFEKLKAKIDL